MSATPQSPRRRPHHLFAVAALAAVVGLIITLSFGYADHSPRPHHLKIAVAAPATIVHAVSAGLDRIEPGGFEVSGAASARAATALVRSQVAAGAFVVPLAGPVTVVTAGANGVSEKQAITAALTGAATHLHRQVRAVDVAPLPLSDRAGLSAFVFELGLLIPSVIGSVGLFLLGVRFRVWWRAAAAAFFAVLSGLLSVLVMDTILGALTHSSAALIGVGAFGALSFVLTIAALQTALGMPGTGVAVVLLIFLGNAVSGGTVSLAFLPDGFRQAAQWLPNAAIVRCVRDVVYFNGGDMGHSLLVLGLWVGVSLVVLFGIDLLHMRERRRSPERAAQIHATPGIALLRRRRAT
jgi:hypothetical protein